MWKADRVGSAKVLPQELMQTLQSYAGPEAAERQTQLAIFKQPDGMQFIMPATQGIGSPYKTDAYTIYTMPDGQRIGYRVRNGEYEIRPLADIYDKLRRETDGREPLIFQPDPVYARCGPPSEFLPVKQITKPAVKATISPKPQNEIAEIKPGVPVPIQPVTPLATKPVVLTVFATPKCPFIDFNIGPILRLLTSKLAEQNSTIKIQVTVIGSAADASDVRKRVFGSGRYPVIVTNASPKALQPYGIKFSGDYVIENLPAQPKPYIKKGWSQKYVLELAAKLGLNPEQFRNDIMHHNDAKEAFESLPKPNQHPIQGCEFMFHHTAQLPAYPIGNLANAQGKVVFLKNHSLLQGRIAHNFVTAKDLDPVTNQAELVITTQFNNPKLRDDTTSYA